MSPQPCWIVAALLLVAAPRAAAEEGKAGRDWPQFRGLRAQGLSEGHALPVEWDVEEWENLLWECPIPGLSHASPIIWQDLIFVVTAVRVDGSQVLKVGLYGSVDSVQDEGLHSFRLLCIDKTDGGIIWEETLVEAVPQIERHPKGSHAASTPATDGKHVVVCLGSEGVYCYDLDGAMLWRRDLGRLDSGWYMKKDAQWGFASSPVIFEDKVLLQCDVQDGSFVAALSLEDGTDLWRTPRDEVPTWSTPTVDVEQGRRQVILNGYKHIGAYDLDTGKERWSLEGGGDIPVPTPVVGHGMVYIANAHGSMAPIFAIRADAQGKLERTDEEPRIAWWHRNRGSYMQTPLLYGPYLYICQDSGVLGCYDARTGEEKYRERLGTGNSGFTASGVAGDGKLYYTSEVGEIVVVKAGPEFERLAVNPMGEECMATPALSEGRLYIRGRSRLFAVGTDQAP